MISSLNFFRDLRPLADFSASTDSSRHTELPEDWFLIITDIKGSTRAIQEGRYKDVNATGVATIAAMVNIDRSVDLPYIFGGDGASFAIPNLLLNRAKKVLADTQEMVRRSFGFELRVAIIPVGELQRRDLYCRVAKWQLTEHIIQTSLSGRGWDEAEKLCKTQEFNEFHLEKMEIDHSLKAADYTGFECRWKPIPTKSWRHIVFLVVCTLQNPQDHANIYQQILETMRPESAELKLKQNQLTMATRLNEVRTEALIQSRSRSLMSKLLHGLRALAYAYLGKYLMSNGKTFGGHDWSKYKQEMIDNTDYRKFDGILRMVIDLSEEQFETCESYLSQLQRERKICFGLHTSTTALITCFIASYSGKHVHFLDGGDGGYALAAKQLKEQLRLFSESKS